MVNPCYQYLPSTRWAKINSGAISLLSGAELGALSAVVSAWLPVGEEADVVMPSVLRIFGPAGRS